MTAAREALTLPALFLSVVLAGGLRLDEPIAFVPPPLFTLVLAMLLLAALVRSGTLAPERLIGPGRSALANLNGLSVLLTAFAASAQALALVMPETGVPAVVAGTLLLVLLAQALAIGPDRIRLVRGLLVTFGATFTIKFIVLAAVSAPAPGRFGRALQLLFEGVTLGAVTQPPLHPAAGYIAFSTLILYLVGLMLLPRAEWTIVRIERAWIAGTTSSERGADESA